MQDRIRIGLLLDNQFAPNWIHTTIAQLLATESIELSLIVFNETPPKGPSGPQPFPFRCWKKVDQWIFRRTLAPEVLTWLAEVGETDDPLAARNCKSYAVPAITLRFEGRTLSANDLSQIRAHCLDVLLQLGSADLPDGILNCAECGVWAFHYSGYNGADSELALFWNLFKGRRTCELVLTASGGRLCRDHVLYRVILSSDIFSLYRNLTLDCCRRSRILLRRLSDLSHMGWENMVMEATAERNTVDERTQTASLSQGMPSFIVSWFLRVLRRLFSNLCLEQQWFFAYGKTSSPDTSEQARVDQLRVVMPPRGQNYCDPFPFEHNGRMYLFFELYVGDQPGTIWCAEVHDDGTLSEAFPVLTRNYHLSYPLIFESHGDIYMMPETRDNKTVELYVAVDFPHRWEFAAVLLRNITAVDSTILEHNGKLWLFAAGLGGAATESSELSLFFADSLLGEWHPHPKNPIVRDVRRARPAGNLFLDRNVLIRPAQDCSECYGYAISLNQVEVISETDYKESFLTTILPNWMPNLCATHTFNQRDGFRVLDGRRWVRRWRLSGDTHPLTVPGFRVPAGANLSGVNDVDR
jgi:hypothetical protein